MEEREKERKGVLVRGDKILVQKKRRNRRNIRRTRKRSNNDNTNESNTFKHPSEQHEREGRENSMWSSGSRGRQERNAERGERTKVKVAFRVSEASSVNVSVCVCVHSFSFLSTLYSLFSLLPSHDTFLFTTANVKALFVCLSAFLILSSIPLYIPFSLSFLVICSSSHSQT